MIEKEKESANKKFSQVNKKFDRFQIETHNKDECWNFDLIDKTILAKYNEYYKFIFTIIEYHTKFV